MNNYDDSYDDDHDDIIVEAREETKGKEEGKGVSKPPSRRRTSFVSGWNNFSRAVRVFGKIAPATLRWSMGNRNHEALRDAIVGAGPVCVKAAQWAIDRGGFLPNDIVEALLPLQDNHASHTWSHTASILDAQFPDGTFAWVQTAPFACGSIGQVYRAELTDGRSCVIKVLHPNIRGGLECDLEALLLILKLIPSCRNFDMDEIRTCVVAQTDLRAEADNLRTFRRNFRGQDRIRFPEPIHVASEALVESFVEGVSFDVFAKMHPHLVKDAIIARIATYIKMGWVDNFLHGDMHRGNILYSRNDADDTVVLSIVDAGMVTVVKNAEALKRFVEGMFTLQPSSLATLMVELNSNPHADVHSFHTFVNNISDDLEYEPSALVRYRDILDDIPLMSSFVEEWEQKIAASEANGGKARVIRSCSSNMIKIIRHLLAAIQKYNLVVPGDIILVALTLTVVDGQSELYIDPTDNVFQDALIFAKEIGLIDMVKWLKYDPVPLLMIDRARRHRGRRHDETGVNIETMDQPAYDSESESEEDENREDEEQ